MDSSSLSSSSARGQKFNPQNSAVKRILQEIKEMQKDQETNKDYMSMPLEEDIFEWQFAIHGPRDSEFEGGIYHGRIVLPANYPFKPPSFIMLTPSGRFEVNSKVCLSISNYHPEEWQPSWSVRTALLALIAFFPSPGDGAIGALNFPREERMKIAIKSRDKPPKYGSPERQRVIDTIHNAMIRYAPPVPKGIKSTCSASESREVNCKKSRLLNPPVVPSVKISKNVPEATPSKRPAKEDPESEILEKSTLPSSALILGAACTEAPSELSTNLILSSSALAPSTSSERVEESEVEPPPPQRTVRQQSSVLFLPHADWSLVLMSFTLFVSIVAILVRKYYQLKAVVSGGGSAGDRVGSGSDLGSGSLVGDVPSTSTSCSGDRSDDDFFNLDFI